MIEWIWHYGNKLAMLKPKQKSWLLLTPKPCGSSNAVVVFKPHTKSHGQRRRAEKPLLHRVLHTAKFKAQHGTASKVEGVAVAPKDTDSEMGDVDVTGPPHSTALDAANPGGGVGLVTQTRGTSSDQWTPDATAVHIDFETLEVVDHDP